MDDENDNDLQTVIAQSLILAESHTFTCFCGRKFRSKDDLQVHQLLCLVVNNSDADDPESALDSGDEYVDALTPEMSNCTFESVGDEYGEESHPAASPHDVPADDKITAWTDTVSGKLIPSSESFPAKDPTTASCQ